MSSTAEWRHDPPWKHTADYDFEGENDCPRCGETIPPKHRHFWKPCLACAIRSVAAQGLLFAYGLNGHPWLYWGSYPACSTCDGEGYMPCELQDLSVMRRWGACEACGVTATILMRDGSDLAETAQHADDQADHPVVVVARPLVAAISDTFDRHLPKSSLEPTDHDWMSERPCPDCGYTIHPGWQHGRHPQPEGASHVVCRLQRALSTEGAMQ